MWRGQASTLVDNLSGQNVHHTAQLGGVLRGEVQVQVPQKGVAEHLDESAGFLK